MATDGTFTTSRAAQRHIGYLPPREMADSSSSSCLISTLSWVSRVAATVSLTSGIDGSWSLSRNSSSQLRSRLLVIEPTRSNVFSAVDGRAADEHRRCAARTPEGLDGGLDSTAPV